MSAALGLPSDQELERGLRNVGASLAFPADPGPAFAAAVRRRLEAKPEAERRGVLERIASWLPQRPVRRVLVVVVTVLSLAVGAAAAATFGVRGIRILFAPPSATAPSASGPGPSASTSPPVTPAPLGQGLTNGVQVTLAQAQARASFRILLPALPGLGAPEVYLNEGVPGGEVQLVYPAGRGLPAIGSSRVGMLVTEFVGQVERPFLEKIVSGGGSLTDVSVGGRPGIWIQGVHSVLLVDRNGVAIDETLRLSDSALLWEHGDVTIRLESGLTRSQAIRIGATVR